MNKKEIIEHNHHKDQRAYVQQWGNSASLTLLDKTCMIFKVPNIEGAIGYRTSGKSHIVFGDPVCAADDIPALTQAFHEFSKKNHKNVMYVAASESFTDWVVPRYCKIALEIGVEFILNPMDNPKAATGQKASMLRNKYNQAVRDGIHVTEYAGRDSALEQAIENVGHVWLQQRKGPQIYLYAVDIFAYRESKRWFYAKHNNTIVGVLIINRVDAHQGWAINLLMIATGAPTTTSEFLVLHALDVLRHEKCEFLTVGTNPTTELDRIQGLNPVMTWLVKNGFKLAKKIFKLNVRQRYWKKFKPRTKRSFLVCANPRIRLMDVLSIMRAMHVKI